MKYKNLIWIIVIFCVLYYLSEQREYFTITGETADKQIVTSDMDGNLISTDAQHLLQLPIGSIIPWVFPTVPDGWLLCNGDTVSGEEYDKLFEVLGSYTLPDLRGKVPVGKQALDDGLLNDVEGTSTTRTLTTVPTHNHGISYGYSNSNVHSGNSIKAHPWGLYTRAARSKYTDAEHTGIMYGGLSWITPPTGTGNSGSTTAAPFSVVQKTYIVNYIIKY